MDKNNTSECYSRGVSSERIDELSGLLHRAVQHFDDGMWITTKKHIEHINDIFQDMYPTL